MSGNMKGLLAVLSLGAIASLVYLSSIFRGTSHVTALADPTVLQAQTLGLLEGPRDTDGDGLTDQEETYWEADFKNADTDGDGFKDGEEVLSGHDPAVPGPNDWLDRSKNITERTTRLMIGGILAGDLAPGAATYDASVQDLAERVLEQYRQNTEIVVDDVTLTSRDDEETRKGYVLQMAWIINGVFVPAVDDAEKFLRSVSDIKADDPSPLTDDPKRLAAFMTAARKLAQASSDRAIKVAAISVPRSFAVQHKNAIRILRALQRQYELAATVKKDTLQGMVALQGIIQLHTETMPNFMLSFAQTVARNISDAR